ncbi:MAG: DUF4271 domain-containing protein [Bacteroidia bacterium]
MLIERHIPPTAETFVLFMLFFIVFALLIKFSSKIVGALIVAFFSEKTLNKKIKEEFFLKNYPSTILLVLSALALSSNVYLIFKGVILLNILQLTMALFTFLGIKLLTILLLSKFISVRENALRPIYYIEVLGAQTVGVFLIFLLPIALWISMETYLMVFIFLIGFFIIYKWIRQMRISFLRRTSLFYNILYFCALELVPVLVLFKQMSSF